MSQQRRVHLVSFGTAEYDGSLCALRHSALHAGGADAVRLFGTADVRSLFDAHPELLRDSRGYGWWAWKPHVIKAALDAVPDGDVVVYCDAAAVVEAPLRAYADAMPADRDIVLFRLGEWGLKDHTIGRWTHEAALGAMAEELGVGAGLLRPQVCVSAAVQMYRAGPAARAFVGEYAAWCRRADVVAGPMDSHRHDQSVLSVLASCYGTHLDVWRDPTQFGLRDPPLGPPGLPAPLLRHHRARLPLPPKVAVVTASTGGLHLRRCLESVQAQTYPNVEHWVFADGPEFHEAVDAQTRAFQGRMPVVRVPLPRNTGAGGWNGHRVYAAASWLVDAPLIAFFDDDNEMEPDHVRSLVDCLAQDGTEASWAYSLRRIIDQESRAVCDDTCESLGGLAHTCLGPGDRLIDTSCYLLPRELAADVSACWNAPFRGAGPGPEADRALARALLLGSADHVRGACSRRHSVRYRVGTSERSVQAQFFADNIVPGRDFENKPDAYVFHFGRQQTAEYFAKRAADLRAAVAGTPAKSRAYEEWQMTLWRGLETTHNLLDGFANADCLPRGATCLAVMCRPEELPLDLFERRDDLVKLCYTLESPNIRHQAQWDACFLTRHFTRLLTYWRPLLDDFRTASIARYCPHNTHHLDLDDPADASQLRANAASAGPRSVGMVLERRALAGEYSINGVQLRCLDALREKYAQGLAGLTVFGQGWDQSEVVRSGAARLGHALHRSRDPRSNVDILQDFAFNLIVENCDAEGYASEKLYDALVAGCIPLYYGSAPDFVPPDLYLDLRRFEDGAAVQRHLDALTDEEILAWRRRVADARLDVLRHVSTAAFAEAVRAAL